MIYTENTAVLTSLHSPGCFSKIRHTRVKLCCSCESRLLLSCVSFFHITPIASSCFAASGQLLLNAQVGNLSLSTQTDCSHSQTDWQRRAFAGHEDRQQATSESGYTSQLNWLHLVSFPYKSELLSTCAAAMAAFNLRVCGWTLKVSSLMWVSVSADSSTVLISNNFSQLISALS